MVVNEKASSVVEKEVRIWVKHIDVLNAEVLRQDIIMV